MFNGKANTCSEASDFHVFTTVLGVENKHVSSHFWLKTTQKDKDSFPEIIRIKTHTKKEYFIAKDMVLPLVPIADMS